MSRFSSRNHADNNYSTSEEDEDDDDDVSISDSQEKEDAHEVESENSIGDDEKGQEVCQLGQETCTVPHELFDLSDLRNILSLETWNFSLSEEERRSLIVYLPPLDQDEFQKTLRSLFGGENLYFGSPMTKFFQHLKGGFCQPKIAMYKEGLQYVERKEHYHVLRSYHDGMINCFLQMQKLWKDYPDADLEERLDIWRSWKIKESKDGSFPNLSKSRLSTLQRRRAQLAEQQLSTLGQNAKDMVEKHTKEGYRGAGSKQDMSRPLASCKKPAKPGLKSASKVKVSLTEYPCTDPLEVDEWLSDEAHQNQRNKKMVNTEEETNCQRQRKDIFKNKGQHSKEMQPLSSPPSESGDSSEDTGCTLPKDNSPVKSSKFIGTQMSPATSTFPSTFPFSVMHLLNATREALLVQRNAYNGDSSTPIFMDTADLTDSNSATQFFVPFTEIVDRVQKNPGDRQILDTQQPLQELVHGALRVMASKVAPLGAKGWKPLVVYDNKAKSWSWTGPIRSSSWTNPIRVLSQTSEDMAEDWGIPSKTLSKLIEMFISWFKNGEESKQQMVQMPLPPRPLLDEKDRFRDLRAQKSLITIAPSSEDMRVYFRKEEILRYSVPDRAFAYTAADGRKSIVAPLRRSSSKARDHFMLKPDRPPNVTILCLVRDAAARLPGSIGTRADVCALIRDSQFIVEDVSDAQVNQVVSGALDRLHYERDPCVRYDGDQKLWLYLHSQRDELDFEDDGTSSTKRWKRIKKESPRELVISSLETPPFSLTPLHDESSAIYSSLGTSSELVYSHHSSLPSPPRVLSTLDSGLWNSQDFP